MSNKWGPVHLEHFAEITKDCQENKEVYDALAKIKKLNIAELQEILAGVANDSGYKDFELGKPEIQKDVVVEFSAQDTKTDRKEYDSRMDLQKAIKKSLENTNWRLMSDGVSYRLGILTGRLRGVEGEENLKKLVTKPKK